MQTHHRPCLHFALLVRCFIFGVGFAEKGQGCPVCSGRRLDHVRQEPFAGQVVTVGEIFATATPQRFSVGPFFQFQRVRLWIEFAFHVAAKIKITAVCDAFELTEFTGRQEREGVLNVGCAGRIMAQFIRIVFAQLKTLTSQPQVGVPLHAPVAPVLVPLLRLVRVTEKLDLHLLEFAASESEITGRNFVAEALSDLGDAEGYADACAIDDVFEVDEDPLCGFGPQECCTLIATQRSHNRLEHQVEFTWLGQRAKLLGVGA